jgi:hypothetical protein
MEYFNLWALYMSLYFAKLTVRIFIKITKKMQLCRIIYYSIVLRLLYMFRAILSLIIRSILTVITASGFIHVCRCRLLSWPSGNGLNAMTADDNDTRE